MSNQYPKAGASDSCELRRARLLRPPARADGVRRAGALQPQQRRHRRGGRARPHPRRQRDAVVLPAHGRGARRSAARSATRRASSATRRRSCSAPGSGSAVFAGDPAGHRPGPAPGRPALHGRGRDADAVPARRSRTCCCGAPLAFTAEQKSDAQRHSNNYSNIGRLQPGATLGQAQAQVDALNAANLERFPQYKELLINAGLPHHGRGAPGDRLVEGRARHAVPALGRRAVRAPHRLRERREPRPGARARAAQGDGDAARAGRGGASPRAAARGREHPARRWPRPPPACWWAAAALRSLGVFDLAGPALRLGDPPRRRGPSSTRWPWPPRSASRSASSRSLAVFPANLAAVLREEGRSVQRGTRRARPAPRARRRRRWRSPSSCSSAPACCSPASARCCRSIPGFARRARPHRVHRRCPARATRTTPRCAPSPTRRCRRVRALPGVVAAGATDTIPFGGSNNDSVILAEGYQMKPGESVISPSAVDVTPGYFEAMGVTLREGRFFQDSRRRAGALPGRSSSTRRWRGGSGPDRIPSGGACTCPSDINNLLGSRTTRPSS